MAMAPLPPAAVAWRRRLFDGAVDAGPELLVDPALDVVAAEAEDPPAGAQTPRHPRRHCQHGDHR
ncbi:unnamed protein product [Spirodela intermedia]|uniref:Uncharacterized protein n=1 Tax=Spirodela intermedia TaxID=51605 RepID=A0A7I8K869_SPIIN|nr:unnamed protein product [Spirodela intermedia]